MDLPSEPVDLAPVEPDAHLMITYEEKPRELFMSFMRLNALIRVVESPTACIRISLDPDISEQVLQTMLAEGVRNGEHFVFELDDKVLSNEDAEKIVEWSQDHLLYFFTKRFQQVAEKAKRLEPISLALLSQAPGSPASTSETASAGPSVLSPAS